MKLQSIAAAAAAVLAGVAAPACAQEMASVDTASAANGLNYVEDGVSPFGKPELTNADAASVKMPALAFTPDASDAGNYDKYYYFHRPNTDFATTYADIRECDGYAQGLVSGVAYQQTPYPYAGTLGGAIGGALGNVLAQAIFGSGEKRRVRRVNMRTCMHFKGYDRYGLPKKLWTAFNFEEGFSSVDDKERDRALGQQALVAASATPEGKALGL